MQQQQPLPWLEITSAQFPAPGRDYFGPSERIERAELQGSKRAGGLERCRRGWVPMKYDVLKQCDLNYCNGSLPTATQLDIKPKRIIRPQLLFVSKQQEIRT
jgi:hypothetical protein